MNRATQRGRGRGRGGGHSIFRTIDSEEAGKREKETGEKAIAGINSDIRVISAQQSASLLENARCAYRDGKGRTACKY